MIVNPLRIHPTTVLELEYNLLLCFTGATRARDHIIEDQTARYEASDEDADRRSADAEGAGAVR